MSFAKKLGHFVFSRGMLGFVLLVCLGLGLWFGGPYLGVGDVRPLEDSGVRIMLLVLILSFLLFWLLHWPVSIVGGAALCLLIWYGAPLLAVGNAYPLAPEAVRIGIVGLIALLFCVYFGYRLWTALQADNALLRKILNPTGESPAREQIQEIHHGMRKALGHLRAVTTGVSGIQRIFQHSRYIYELPWYMVFGAPGTGKTTLVLNSGLKFPLAEQAGAVSLSGVKGTRNCVWWFTDEAVLIDTAGRYTTHETNTEVDAAEWKGFLGLLRKYRPRAPLNGAVVAVSVEELAGTSAIDLVRLAANIRERLIELQDELGVSLPIYFLITKMDLVQGFRAYFQHLNSEGRRQVFGFTLPVQAKSGRNLADIRQACEGELLLLQERLEQGLNLRLHEEFVPERRRELYCLPGDFHELSAPLMQLIENIFFESRYDTATMRHQLRGIYFTSAVQENSCLALGKVSLLQRFEDFVQKGVASLGRGVAASRTMIDSRSYFLENTLREVIFREAALVRPNARWELRFLLVRGIGHIVILLAAFGIGGALLTSADNNTQLLHVVSERVGVFADNLHILNNERGEDGLSYVLEQACSITKLPDIDVESPPFAYRVGLYSAAGVDDAATQLCISLRERFLIPRFASVLENELTSSVKQAGKKDKNQHGLKVYNALKMYAMFYDPEQFDAKALMDWFVAHIASGGESGIFRDNPSLVGALKESLLRTPDFERTAPVQKELLTSARDYLRALGREQRLYLLVRQALESEAPEDFLPVRHAGDDGALVRVGGSMADAIPGIFTYAGYHEVFLPRLDDLLPDAVKTDAWLMDDTSSKGGIMANQAEHGKLHREIRKLYYADYVRQWMALIESIHVGIGNSPEHNLVLLNRLGSADSPLERLARVVVRETAISARDQSVSDQLSAQVEKRLRRATRTTNIKFGNVDESAQVDSRFANLRKTITGSAEAASARAPEVKTSAEMEEIRLLVTEFALYTRDLQKSSANRALPPVSDIVERLRARALQSPPFISNVLMDLADRGTTQEGTSKGSVLGTLAGQAADPCARLVGTKYPFVAQGRDADPADFARVFGPDGLMDKVFSANLAPLVDSSVSPWTYLKDFPGAPELAPFERAVALREALYGDGKDKLWRLPVRISVVDMDSRIERLELQIAGKTMVYAHGPDNPFEVVWEGGGPQAVVSMSFYPRRPGLKPVTETGPWALLRLMGRGKVVNHISPEDFWIEYDINGFSLTLAVSTPAAALLTSDLFQGFQCPEEVKNPLGAAVAGEAP